MKLLTYPIPIQRASLFARRHWKHKNKRVKLHIVPEVTRKDQNHRRIPFPIRKDVEAELQQLKSLDVIDKVERLYTLD